MRKSTAKQTKNVKNVKQETFLGLPGSSTWPGWKAIGRNMWDRSPNAVFMPPKVYGWGWSLNVAYPLIKSKPILKRVFAGILILAMLLIFVFALCAFFFGMYLLATGRT